MRGVSNKNCLLTFFIIFVERSGSVGKALKTSRDRRVFGSASQPAGHCVVSLSKTVRHFIGC